MFFKGVEMFATKEKGRLKSQRRPWKDKDKEENWTRKTSLTSISQMEMKEEGNRKISPQRIFFAKELFHRHISNGRRIFFYKTNNFL
jgi:hypothetical protein